MAAIAKMYNALPTLEDADKLFVDREGIFAAAATLLAQYGNAFGICLIHAHCTVTEDEIMLAQGNISRPKKVSSLDKFYPERWLPSGEAYEFTTRPTTSPPPALVDEFNQLTSHIGVLGLYHVDNEGEGKMIEHTEGRTNILMPYVDTIEASSGDIIETAWNLGKGDPVTMACVIVCDARVTRNSKKHFGTYRRVQLEFQLAY